MKKLLLSSVLVVSLSGCLMPSGVNPSLGCSPITGCTSKDYYLPGKGVRAPRQNFGPKAKIGAVVGTVGGSMIGASTGDPFITAAGAVGGLVLGYSIGDTMDKVDEIHATINLRNALNNNPDGVYSTYKNPNKRVTVVAAPVSTNGNCRTFENIQIVGDTQKKITGRACKVNGEWVLKELNK